MPPSAEHELPIELARLDPEMVAWLFAEVGGYSVPAHAVARSRAADVQVTVPATYHADAILVYADEADRPVLVIVWEVQRSRDRRKMRTWRTYLAHAEDEFDAPAELVVYCPDPEVARWYEKVLAAGNRTSLLRPLFITPGDLPVRGETVSPSASGTHSEPPLPVRVLTVLARVASAEDSGTGGESAADLTELTDLAAAIDTVGRADWETYYDVMLAGLPSGLRTFWEELMTTATRSRWHSEKFQRMEAEHMAKGRAEALLIFLASRGIEVPDSVRQQIVGTTDADVLATWIQRAATATTLAEVIGH